MLYNLTVGFFLNFFSNSNIIGILLAIAFGIIWIVSFWPSLIKEPWYWAILVGGTFITLIAYAFIQRPLQYYLGTGMTQVWSSESLKNSILLSGLPSILLIGLIQEGAKLLPVVIYWWRKGMKIDYRLGLTLGAIAGAGFGIMEAQWIHNIAFAQGWSWNLVRMRGFEAFLPFIERFFVIGFSTGATALAGYGLAKGKGWQFYLIATALHMVLNYSIFLVQAQVFKLFHAILFVIIWSLLTAGIALWLRWKKTEVVKAKLSYVKKR